MQVLVILVIVVRQKLDRGRTVVLAQPDCTLSSGECFQPMNNSKFTQKRFKLMNKEVEETDNSLVRYDATQRVGPPPEQK